MGERMTTKPKTRKAPAAASKREKEIAAMDFEPWIEDGDKFPTPEEINNPHLIMCRLAYTLMFKTKPEMIKMFESGEEDGVEPAVLEMLIGLRRSQKFFNHMVSLLGYAEARLMVAGTSYMEHLSERDRLRKG